MTDNANKIIYSDIKQELDILLNIIPENKNLLKLNKATDYFQNDKEGLLIIRNGLKNIKHSINKIKKDGRDEFSSSIKEILANIKYN